MTSTQQPSAYAASGVSIEAGDRAVELMKEWVDKARRPEVVGGIGGFAGLFDASALKDYRRPLLATSADGVGTKVQIAQRMDVHDTIGYDLVGMLVDDLVVCGAEPLFMTDYIACGKVHPERIAAIVRGIAEACSATGTALVGGETAEHPGLLGADDYDVAGAAVGVVEADAVLGPERVTDGDAVIAMASSGLHSNGFSLVRRVVADNNLPWDIKAPFAPERTLAEALLVPTQIYVKNLLALCRAARERPGLVKAMAHITGGGLVENVPRVIPDELTVEVDATRWKLPPVFAWLAKAGGIETAEMSRVFNCGIGMVLVAAAEDAEETTRRLQDSGETVYRLGSVTPRAGRAGCVVSNAGQAWG